MTAPSVTVNGRLCPMADVDSHTTALDWLRGRGLTGAKEGCAEGECGACAVLVARAAIDGTAWVAVNSCLMPIAALDGQEILTAEGLGTPDELHPVQAAMASGGASQCGYCTPGFVCSMAAEYYRSSRSTQTEPHAVHRIDQHRARSDHEHGPNGFDLHALSGNLCRCTGYRPIRDAAWSLGAPTPDDRLARRRTEPAPSPAGTRIATGRGMFVRPLDLPEALRLLQEHPDAIVVAGSTDWGVEVNLRGARRAWTIAVDRLPELRDVTVDEDVIEIGAGLALTEVEQRLAGRVPLLSELFPQFGSRLIRNAATIGGNLGTGSPIGDTPPALLALEASVVLVSPAGQREVALADYFTGYRQSVRAPGEIIRAVRIPRPLSEVTAFHKIAKRRFDDISSVAVGFALDVADGHVVKARIGLGGVAATAIRATATETALEGRPWTTGTVEEAATVMRSEGTPIDDHRASAAYRTAMLGEALRRLYADHAARGEATA